MDGRHEEEGAESRDRRFRVPYRIKPEGTNSFVESEREIHVTVANNCHSNRTFLIQVFLIETFLIFEISKLKISISKISNLNISISNLNPAAFAGRRGN